MINDRALLAWLALGGILTVFCGGRLILPVAMWLAPVLFVHVARGSPPGMLVLVWLVIGIANAVGNRGVIPIEGAAYFVTSLWMALPLALAVAADRLVVTRAPASVAVFAFPLAWATVSFLFARFMPFATWGSPAYTQYGDLPLMQLSSVTGLSGIIFLIGWFASAANAVWDRSGLLGASRGVLIPFAFAVIAAGRRPRLLPARRPFPLPTHLSGASRRRSASRWTTRTSFVRQVLPGPTSSSPLPTTGRRFARFTWRWRSFAPSRTEPRSSVRRAPVSRPPSTASAACTR